MKPVLLLYCQHSVGVGHLTRSLALAAALCRRFSVVFLNGGPPPDGFAVPPGVELVDLPALGTDDGHALVSRDVRFSVAEARELRRAKVLEIFAQRRPDVIVIELFPFGRKKFANELLPLLRAARAAPERPLVVSSVRDILVSARPDQQQHDDRAAWLCRRYFDGVLVHADPALARFEESFKPRTPLVVPLAYTGFVVPRRDGLGHHFRESHCLVSAGGGLVGMPLFRSVIAAHALLEPTTRIPLRFVAGPHLPAEHWVELGQLAEGHADITLVRSVPDLALEMQRARCSISQCGYNTAMDIVVSRVPALVVPYAAEREDEQRNRARRMASLGLLQCQEPAELNPRTLADAMIGLRSFHPDSSALNTDGADETARLLQLQLEARREAFAARTAGVVR